MQEVSRVGAQGVTSKSKLLAREMPDLHTGGLRLIWDRAPCHMSKAVDQFLEGHADRLVVWNHSG